MEPELRVVVADDHPVYRGGLLAALGDVAGLVVVADVADGPAAVTAAVELAADVVLMDLSMPGGSGIEATAELRRRRPVTAVIALTMHEDSASLAAAVAAGARGYLVKGATQEEIVRAVRTVAAGDVLFDGSVAEHLVAALGAGGRAGPGSAFPTLTAREVEILEEMAAGRGNAEIARRLVLADKTVRNHVSNVLTKLGCDSRAAAVALARDAGLAQPAQPGCRSSGSGRGRG
jgi:DNA-binding NarL/FixJ family response regulator